MKSDVTVIIPCFNDGAFILEAVNSILDQTLKAEKIIIIDDGSGIETINVLKGIKNERIQVIFQENKGVCKTRNTAISLAKTKYILNLDADDYFENTFIEKAVKILNGNLNIGVVGCYYKTFGNKSSGNIIKPTGGEVKNFLFKNNGLASCLFRKICWEQASGFDEAMVNGYEDWEFWISVLKNNWKMHIIAEPLFNYRIKETSRDAAAFANHDLELKTYIFNKHKQIYIDNFESYIMQSLYATHQLKKNNFKIKETKEFKIGQIILAPFKFFKNKFASLIK
ncbi:glycosyltransferase family 2 protein [Algibacter sp. R77976]|uniref:glycosyltransferase family 2 protein n=1 Tax=Algibacter sp. R77976 TaxID=3093873 RepID=UPI0037C82CD7